MPIIKLARMPLRADGGVRLPWRAISSAVVETKAEASATAGVEP